MQRQVVRLIQRRTPQKKRFACAWSRTALIEVGKWIELRFYAMCQHEKFHGSAATMNGLSHGQDTFIPGTVVCKWLTRWLPGAPCCGWIWSGSATKKLSGKMTGRWKRTSTKLPRYFALEARAFVNNPNDSLVYRMGSLSLPDQHPPWIKRLQINQYRLSGRVI